MDSMSKEARSRTMSRVRTRNTAPEQMLRQALRVQGVRGYRLHRKDVPGCPDLCWIGRKVAVFVDGAFWHGHPSAYRQGQSGAFWDEKIAKNINRDSKVNQLLEADGWLVVRLWDFEIEQDPVRCAERVQASLKQGRLPA